MKRLLVFFYLLVFPASLMSDDPTKSCYKPGITTTDDDRGFVVCSKDSDGYYTTQTGECEEGAVFSLADRKCQVYNTMELRSLRAQPDSFTCYNRGYVCADCKTLNYCWNADKGYTVVATKQCPDNQYCSAYSNSCDSAVIPQCSSDYQFVCNYMGLFPDPYKCDTYYFCQSANSKPVNMTCPTGQYYSPLYMECIDYEVNSKPPCPPMDQCTADNTLTALSSNPNIYYLCIKTGYNSYITRVFRCPRGGVFNGDSCVSSVYATTSNSYSYSYSYD